VARRCGRAGHWRSGAGAALERLETETDAEENVTKPCAVRVPQADTRGTRRGRAWERGHSGECLLILLFFYDDALDCRSAASSSTGLRPRRRASPCSARRRLLVSNSTKRSANEAVPRPARRSMRALSSPRAKSSGRPPADGLPRRWWPRSILDVHRGGLVCAEVVTERS